MPSTTFHARLTRALREARSHRHRREEALLAAMVRAHAAKRYEDLRLLLEQLRPIYRQRVEPAPENAAQDRQAQE